MSNIAPSSGGRSGGAAKPGPACLLGLSSAQPQSPGSLSFLLPVPEGGTGNEGRMHGSRSSSVPGAYLRP